jgi:hypothetical protein
MATNAGGDRVPEDDVTKSLAAAQRALGNIESLKIATQTFPTLDALRRAAEPAAAAIKAFNLNDERLRELGVVLSHRGTLTAAFGSIDKETFDLVSGFARDIQVLRQVITDFDARFKLPPFNEISNLVANFENSDLRAQLRQLGQSAENFKLTMEGMRSPWLDIQDQLKSSGRLPNCRKLALPCTDFRRLMMPSRTNSVTLSATGGRRSIGPSGFFMIRYTVDIFIAKRVLIYVSLISPCRPSATAWQLQVFPMTRPPWGSMKTFVSTMIKRLDLSELTPPTTSCSVLKDKFGISLMKG